MCKHFVKSVTCTKYVIRKKSYFKDKTKKREKKNTKDTKDILFIDSLKKSYVSFSNWNFSTIKIYIDDSYININTSKPFGKDCLPFFLNLTAHI